MRFTEPWAAAVLVGLHLLPPLVAASPYASSPAIVLGYSPRTDVHAFTSQFMPAYNNFATSLAVRADQDSGLVYYGLQSPVPPNSLFALMRNASLSMSGERTFSAYSMYFQSTTFANDFVIDACTNRGAFSQTSLGDNVAAARLGGLLLSVWQLAMHQMDVTVSLCHTSGSPALASLDLFWIYFAGANNSNANNLLFGLSHDLCTSPSCVGGWSPLSVRVLCASLLFFC